MRTDSLDVSSLVSYIKDIKPFHSKLTDVMVEYQANDHIGVKVTDRSKFEMKFSSIWEMEFVSDGRRVQYRIPAAVFPRYSDDFHQSHFKGVIDEVPGIPGAYSVPFNNGLEVFVNGVRKYLDIDYTTNDSRTMVQFLDEHPKVNDDVRLNWAVIDRVFIAMDTVSQVLAFAEDGIEMKPYDEQNFDSAIPPYIGLNWKEYALEIGGTADGMDMYPYDTKGFGSSSSNNPSFSGPTDSVKIGSIGRVRALKDADGKEYYVFEFNEAPPVNTKIWIRVEQREGYNGWAQTTFTETIKFLDSYRFEDTVNAWIVDPGTWNQAPSDPKLIEYTFATMDYDSYWNETRTAETIFGIDPGPYRSNKFDMQEFDVLNFDSTPDGPKKKYPQLFKISEFLADSITTKIVEKVSDRTGIFEADRISALFAENKSLNVALKQNESVATAVSDENHGATTARFLITKKNNGPKEVTSTQFAESVSFQVVYYELFDQETFDTTPYDHKYIVGIDGTYTPDANGMVFVLEPRSKVIIHHYYGLAPSVRVYENGYLINPQSVTYPDMNTTIVEFSEPRIVSIRLN